MQCIGRSETYGMYQPFRNKPIKDPGIWKVILIPVYLTYSKRYFTYPIKQFLFIWSKFHVLHTGSYKKLGSLHILTYLIGQDHLTFQELAFYLRVYGRCKTEWHHPSGTNIYFVVLNPDMTISTHGRSLHLDSFHLRSPSPYNSS